MLLAELIDGLELVLAHGSGTTPIRDLTDDSRTATPGQLFIARSGAEADGRHYIDQAIAAGAVAVVADQQPDAPPESPDGTPIAWVVAQNPDQALAGRLAERFFGHPQRDLTLIGITGTNGKTTTAFLIQHLLQEAGMPCGLIGTIHVDDGASTHKSELTTPGAIELSRLLAAMVANGCKAAVLEASSHALSQRRTAALEFKVAVFTNISGEHLDYHASMEDYLAAKAVLFDSLADDAWAILNADDDSAEQIAANCTAGKLWCTLGDAELDRPTCRAKALELASDHSLVRFDGPWGNVEATLPLIGRHNLANTLQAIAAANAVTDVSDNLRSILERCPQVPGRLEAVRIEGGAPAPTVLVDYAHTHDALANVLETLRPVTKGRLRVMFGCGGDRDRKKRPKMAEVAWRLADDVIITSDNPRTEDPLAIMDEITHGILDEVIAQDDSSGKTCYQCPDRAAAIAAIIADAGCDDVVLLAGKGHEDYQIIGTEKRHFDDREQAVAALAEWPPWVRRSSYWTPKRVQDAIGGRWLIEPADPDTALTRVSTDSRAIEPGQIFVALKGDRFDGHDFVEAAAAAGASLLIVDSAKQPGTDAPVLLVDGTLDALQALASHYRDVLGEAATEVVAVTGSSGKTTTRTLIHQVLSTRGRGTESQQNFNNHIGVPLTLLAASPDDDFVVVEMGSNHPGEIETLARIVRPDMAVLTNVGTAHIGLFGSREAIGTEKGSLLPFVRDDGWAIVPADEPLLADSLDKLPPGVRKMQCSVDPKNLLAKVRCTHLQPVRLDGPLEFTVAVDGGTLAVSLPLLGAHNVANALAAIAVGKCMGVANAAIVTALSNACGVRMRMAATQIPHPEGSIRIINDAYNANPDSMRAALQALAVSISDAEPKERQVRRVAILGDMFELGDAAEDEHRDLGEQLARYGTAIDLVVLIGKLCMLTAETLRKHWTAERVVAYDTWDDTLPDKVAAMLEPADLVLIKASRGMALERLIPAMEKQVAEQAALRARR